MAQEDKKLLLKDLCARLPYDVAYNFGGNTGCDYTMDRISQIAVDEAFPIKEIKPYLRPMSSMTEEEKCKYCDLQDRFLCSSQYPVTDAYELFDWLNAHHFDYRGLIAKGLALEATEDMYKTE